MINLHKMAECSPPEKSYKVRKKIDTALQHAAQVYEAATGKHVEINSVGGGVDLQSELKQRYQAGNMPDIYTCEGTPDFSNWTGMMVDLADQPWAADTEAESESESESAAE